MTADEFRACLDDLSARFNGGPSPVLENGHEIELQDTAICLQWNDSDARIDVSIPLPVVIDTTDDPVQALALMRLLLEHHWTQPDGTDRVVFAVIEELDEIVATVGLDAEGVDDADDLVEQTEDALARALAAWYEACAQVLAQAAAEATGEATSMPTGMPFQLTIA
ncbi:hypothetical protein ACLIJR_12695 [Hydrogenophaga sp. XSHU_21]